MKTVTATWLDGTAKYDSLESLMKENNYVGFTPPKKGNKYFMVVAGPHGEHEAARPNGRFTNYEEQKTTEGEYFIFDSEKELYDWMLDK
jgi:hypothetical protein